MSSAAPSVGPAVAFGDAALLVSAPDAETARQWAAQWRALGVLGVADVVPALRSVLVTFDPEVIEPGALREELTRAGPSAAAAPGGRTHRIPVRFTGPDLAEVAAALALTPAEVVATLSGRTLRVAVVGFSPGFAYLEGLPAGWERVGRRPTPRAAVPSGSLAMAAGFAAIYPQATPGGWPLLGRTSLPMFDAEHPPYARLRAGDTVVVEVLDADPADPEPRPQRPGRRAVPGAFAVEDAGPLSTVQDAGRLGFAHLGVPHAGAADPLRHALANLLVGNGRQTAALELTAHGPRLRCTRDTFVAVTGDASVALDGRRVEAGRVLPVAAGQRLAVGAIRPGLRAYLALAGGLLVPPVMGSCSTDTLSGLGPAPLAAGDHLAVGAPGPLGDHLLPSPAAEPDRRRLRVLPGPHTDWLAGGLEALSTARFTVASESNRVGVRLRRAKGPLSRRAGEVTSFGVVWGAVQLLPSGDPVILGPDHATLGGYPVVAVVIRADRRELGQCRPGEEVGFEPVDLAEAAAARRADPAPDRLIAGHYPVVSSERT